MQAALDAALAKTSWPAAFWHVFRLFYSITIDNMRRYGTNKNKVVEGVLNDLKRQDVILKFVNAIEKTDISPSILGEQNDGDEGQSSGASNGQNAIAPSPSPNGDGAGQNWHASNGQRWLARPSPQQRDGRGHPKVASSGQEKDAPPSPPDRAAKPKHSPGHTTRGSVVIAMKNEAATKRLFSTYMVCGKPILNWKLRELPRLATDDYEKAEVVRLIYIRHHNKDQALTVGEVEHGKADAAYIKEAKQAAVALFRRENSLFATG